MVPRAPTVPFPTLPIFLLWASSGLSSSGHTLSSSNKAQASIPTVRIGYVSSTRYPNGQAAPWGIDMLTATKMAVDDVNAASFSSSSSPSSSSPPFRLVLPEDCIFEASGTAGEALEHAMQRIAGNGVAAVLGGDWTRVAAQMADKRGSLWSSGIPVVSAGATSQSLDRREDYPGLFRTCYSDTDAQSSFSMAALECIKSKSAAVVGSLDPFGYSGLEIFNNTLASLGMNVPEGAYAEFESSTSSGEPRGDGCTGNSTNFAYVCTKVANAVRAAASRSCPSSTLSCTSSSSSSSTSPLMSPHTPPPSSPPVLLVSATGPSTQCVLACLGQRNLTRKLRTILATEVIHVSNKSEAFFNDTVEGSRGYITYIAKPYSEAEAYVNFVGRFRNHTGHDPDVWALYAYDAVFVTAKAIAKSLVSKDEANSVVNALLDSHHYGTAGLTEYHNRSLTFPASRRVAAVRMKQTGIPETDADGALSALNYQTVGITMEENINRGIVNGTTKTKMQFFVRGLADLL